MRFAHLSLIISVSLFAKIDLSDWKAVNNEEEGFFLRRIADFWQEGEYGIAKNQMEQFLASFPESHFSDPIRVCLGDILLRERNFSEALASYSALSSPEFLEKTVLNRMQCLYGLEWYSTLADESETFLRQAIDPENQKHATFYLALSLYNQCLNAAKDPEALQKLAKRAEPYFETLMQSERSFEVTQAFAHLCCILKDYKKAADTYLGLAETDPIVEEEMTFQAALIQSEYDKGLALKSFEKLAKQGQKKASEAAYNHLVLSFEMGNLEEIANHPEPILASVPEDKKGMTHLFIGRSLLSLKKYPEATGHLQAFLDEARFCSPESVQSGLLSLIEAAHQSADVAALDKALSKLSEIEPSSTQMSQGRLLRAQLLKGLGRIDEARKELDDLRALLPDLAAVAFEGADLEYQANSWDRCRAESLDFVKRFSDHEFAPFAWRYFAASSSRLAEGSLEMKERFASDLEFLLEQNSLFSVQETSDWKFYLSQAYFHLGQFEKAIFTLQSILSENVPFSQEANAYLLLGLALRDGRGDSAAFCLNGETALAKGADLLDLGHLHLFLFNAYLELSERAPELMGKSAEHLYEAFKSHADISKENLLWLGDWYFAQKEANRATDLFSHLMRDHFDETACYKLGQIHSWKGQNEDLIAQIEPLIDKYAKEPQADWKWEPESKLLLAEAYLAKGLEEKALNILDQITNGEPANRSETIARAYLEKAKLVFAKCSAGISDENQLSEVGILLKNLILQRKLEQEPVHLEAALEYVDLFGRSFSKRLTLLEKVKKDFQHTDDLLSKDYHLARLKRPDKNRIYEKYMQYIDAEILTAKSMVESDPGIRKELQAKAKDLLLHMKSECTPPLLVKRISSRLQSADVSVVE